MAMPFSSIATGVKGRNLSEVQLQMLGITNTIKLNKSQIHHKTAKSRNHCFFPKGMFSNNPTMKIIAICWLQDAGPNGSSTPNDGRLLSQWPSVLQNMDSYDDTCYTRTTSSLCTWNQTKTIGTDSSCHLPSVLATAILLPECYSKWLRIAAGLSLLFSHRDETTASKLMGRLKQKQKIQLFSNQYSSSSLSTAPLANTISRVQQHRREGFA